MCLSYFNVHQLFKNIVANKAVRMRIDTYLDVFRCVFDTYVMQEDCESEKNISSLKIIGNPLHKKDERNAKSMKQDLERKKYETGFRRTHWCTKAPYESVRFKEDKRQEQRKIWKEIHQEK